MNTLKIQVVSAKLMAESSKIGVRALAKEIGISAATLSRVQRGFLPDLETFRKICSWMKLDPAEVLGLASSKENRVTAAIHFRKQKTMKLETAEALGKLIIAAQRALEAQD